MAKIKIEFNTDNAAFEDADYEMAHVLEQAKNIINSGNYDRPLRDSNGNKVGTVSLED